MPCPPAALRMVRPAPDGQRLRVRSVLLTARKVSVMEVPTFFQQVLEKNSATTATADHCKEKGLPGVGSKRWTRVMASRGVAVEVSVVSLNAFSNPIWWLRSSDESALRPQASRARIGRHEIPFASSTPTTFAGSNPLALEMPNLLRRGANIHPVLRSAGRFVALMIRRSTS